MKRVQGLVVFFLVLGLGAASLSSQVNARMLRYPDVSKSHICFVYANDIWVVAKTGGQAHRLTTPPGEEMFPRFSPDGETIAFSGNYDGNIDIYTIPIRGGRVQRVTHHDMTDRMLGWFPDGEHLLFASTRESGRLRFSQFFLLSQIGGLAKKLPVPYGEFADISDDGRTLAYVPISRDFRTWKRYRGGMAPDVWLFDLETFSARNITRSDANDTQPMWFGKTVYFLSDRGPEKRYNIWSCDTETDTLGQVTFFKDFDIHFPGLGPAEMVFEAGGRLYLLDMKTRKVAEVPVSVVTDDAPRRQRIENVSGMVQNAWPSPGGERVLVEARGELFSLPAEKGVIRNLTQSSGVAERFPAWSPNGQSIAYWSDRSGEYQLTVRDGSGLQRETTLTSLPGGFGYQPYWSPDGKKIAFVNNRMEIKVFDRETKRLHEVDRGLWMYEYGLRTFQPGWSADGRWLAYARGLDNRHRAVFLYDTVNQARHQVTSGYYSDDQPVFDPDGKYLYFLSNRTFRPVYSDLDNSFIYPNTTNVVAVPLRADVMSPLAPENDEPERTGDDPAADPAKKNEKKAKNEKTRKVTAVSVVLEGFERRVVVLPPKPGNVLSLAAGSGKVVFLRAPNTGSELKDNRLVYYDLKERKEETVIEGIDAYRLTADGKKVLAYAKGKLAVIDLKPKQKMEKMVPVSSLEMDLDPVAEWHQIFNDAWRLCRDYFYDPNMHGVDWKEVRERYGTLMKDVSTRRDLNFVIGEMIAELNASHTYRGGGDQESGQKREHGYLGVDWILKDGHYAVGRIIQPAAWDSEVRSPLAEPGIGLTEGDFILAVNGRPLQDEKSPHAAFSGLSGATVELTVGKRPGGEGSRSTIVKTLTLDQEMRLRHLNWIEAKRKYVEKESGGRVGYIYVRSTGIDGQNELVRQFNAQFHLDGLIVDERFNSGGQIPDRFIELLDRKPLAFWSVRDGRDWPWPPVAHFGPKVMLINGWSGSGGDAFPDYFRKAGLGPLIGKRTWGGLIGITGAPPLIDGGFVTVPTFRMYDPDGKWFREGHGVDPDIEVEDDPTQMARGVDPQLKRAVAEILERLEKNPPLRPERPPYEDRSH